MKDHSQKVLKLFAEKVNKLRLLSNNANVMASSATEKAQKTMENIQNLAVQKYGTVVKRINETAIIQNTNAAPLQLTQPMPQRLINWWHWYQQLTGLDTIEVAKQQVIMIQDKLFKCQEERRLLHQRATVTNDKLKEIYAELVQTKREDPKYVHLTIMENKGLQEQNQITGQLNLLENEERDYFTNLATAIKEYHDTQAINAMKYKYLSVIVSVIVALMSLTGSMVYNNKRIAEMRKALTEAQRRNESTVLRSIDSLNKNITAKLSELTNNDKETKSVDLTAIYDKIMGQKNSQDDSYGIGNKTLVYIGLGVVGYFALKAIS